MSQSIIEKELYIHAIQQPLMRDSAHCEIITIVPQSEGPKCMYSGIISEEHGFLALPKDVWEAMPADRCPSSHQAGLYLMIGKNRDGYFTNELFIEQMTRAMLIHEHNCPGKKATFMLDWIGCHRKADPSAIDATKMNVGENGKQPLYGTTVYESAQGPVEQYIGRKGMRRVLEERAST